MVELKLIKIEMELLILLKTKRKDIMEVLIENFMQIILVLISIHL